MKLCWCIICSLIIIFSHLPLNIIHAYKWVKLDDYNGSVPLNAFIGGWESKKFLYVSRVYYDFGVRAGTFPGKLMDNECYISYYGKPYLSAYGCEVLSDFEGHWEPYKDKFPKNAVIGGKDEEFDRLYIGRAKILNDMVIGKVQLQYDFKRYKKELPKQAVLYVPYAGTVIEVKRNFEVLVVSDNIDKKEANSKKEENKVIVINRQKGYKPSPSNKMKALRFLPRLF